VTNSRQLVLTSGSQRKVGNIPSVKSGGGRRQIKPGQWNWLTRVYLEKRPLNSGSSSSSSSSGSD